MHIIIAVKIVNVGHANSKCSSQVCQWQIKGGGGKGGASVPPFGLHLTLRSTDDKLNGTPLSGYRTKKTTAMAHLRML